MTRNTILQNPIIHLEYTPEKVTRKNFIIPSHLSEKLAYYIGYLQGDGCLESNLKRIDFTDEHLEHIHLLNDFTYDLFNVTGNVREIYPKLGKKAVYTLEIGSVDIHRFIRSVFKVPVGVKQNLRIPPVMLQNKEILRWYLRGLFDSDGTLPKDASTVKIPFVDITLKDKTFIEQIQSALRLFDIQTLKPYKRVAKSPHSDTISETWELRIRRKDQMLRFINEIGFFLAAKARRTELLLKRLNAPVAQPGYLSRASGLAK